VLGTLILAVIAVPMVFIAIAVKLDSRGPSSSASAATA
jgi:lipopolysaccharide/colanic/teichoic acid biosynthesis glycosyltransferase